MSDESKCIPVEIKGLMMDPTSNVPIVILRNDELGKMLPIWIGIFEANAIALELEGVEAPRPMTHDLIMSFLETLKSRILRVIVSSLDENTFFAQIYLEIASGEELIIDSRPSDAIALALRAKAPVFVKEAVFEKAVHDSSKTSSSEDEEIKKWLEEVDPNDLGKYTM
jgi:bifunctional DNase/RNase